MKNLSSSLSRSFSQEFGWIIKGLLWIPRLLLWVVVFLFSIVLSGPFFLLAARPLFAFLFWLNKRKDLVWGFNNAVTYAWGVSAGLITIAAMIMLRDVILCPQVWAPFKIFGMNAVLFIFLAIVVSNLISIALFALFKSVRESENNNPQNHELKEVP